MLNLSLNCTQSKGKSMWRNTLGIVTTSIAKPELKRRLNSDGAKYNLPSVSSQSRAETATHATTHMVRHVWRGASLTRHVGKATTGVHTLSSALHWKHCPVALMTLLRETLTAWVHSHVHAYVYIYIYMHNPNLSHIKYICVNVYDHVCLTMVSFCLSE